ncbi:VOC family protein [Haladaptatus halobius]|uniref:VOC family protein n=1 Tax=Haladaptatus halobius TaxID=2884875 RepID=UPI001D0B4EC6|nr:VOC family protein [Haladaptatus halobius]
MKSHIRVITLGVADLKRSTQFYEDGLGLPLQGIFGNDADESTVAFFDINDDMILALYPKDWLANDANVEPTERGGASFSIGQTVESKDEVDEVVEQAANAGAAVPEPPRDRVWGGYSGYFRDLDGHLWEIVWNPDLVEN